MANETPTAAAAFRDLAMHYPGDPLAALHHRRLAEGSRGDLVVLTEK
jgi:hypothetical protein